MFANLKIWLKIKVLFYFKLISFVSSCIKEIHIHVFCFPSNLSFSFLFHSFFHSVFHSVPFSVLRFSNTYPKVNALYMEFVVCSSFKISFKYFACQNIRKTSKPWLKILVLLKKFLISHFNLKWYDMDKLFDIFPHRNIITVH